MYSLNANLYKKLNYAWHLSMAIFGNKNEPLSKQKGGDKGGQVLTTESRTQLQGNH